MNELIILLVYIFLGGMFYSIKVTRHIFNEQIKNGAMVKGKHLETKIWLVAFIQLLAFPLEGLLFILERTKKK